MADFCEPIQNRAQDTYVIPAASGLQPQQRFTQRTPTGQRTTKRSNTTRCAASRSTAGMSAHDNGRQYQKKCCGREINVLPQLDYYYFGGAAIPDENTRLMHRSQEQSIAKANIKGAKMSRTLLERAVGEVARTGAARAA